MLNLDVVSGGGGGSRSMGDFFFEGGRFEYGFGCEVVKFCVLFAVANSGRVRTSSITSTSLNHLVP